jgi:hypothetical protein
MTAVAPVTAPVLAASHTQSPPVDYFSSGADTVLSPSGSTESSGDDLDGGAAHESSDSEVEPEVEDGHGWADWQWSSKSQPPTPWRVSGGVVVPPRVIMTERKGEGEWRRDEGPEEKYKRLFHGAGAKDRYGDIEVADISGTRGLVHRRRSSLSGLRLSSFVGE